MISGKDAMKHKRTRLLLLSILMVLITDYELPEDRDCILVNF